MNEVYQELVNRIMQETDCVSMSDDADLAAAAQELAEGVTAERDAEIAEALPKPYQKKVPARAQIDGDELTIPRCVIAQASHVAGQDWRTSTRGPRMGRAKAGCVVGVHQEFVMPGVMEIVRVVILWRRDK